MRVAVIVPTFDDDVALERLLSHLAYLEPGPDDVIVSDGACSDATELLCRRFGATYVASRSGRGGQLALGAARARAADVLWFLETICEPHADAVIAIHECVQNGAVGGYFRFQFGGATSFGKRMLESCIALRCQLGTVYGEQGIFVTRSAYARTLGFTIQPLFEQVKLVRALKKTDRFIPVPLPLGVSPRRWEKEGFVLRTLRNRALALGYMLGIAPAALARWNGARTSYAASEVEETAPGKVSSDTEAAGKH
jgi:glycosyltransferase involved in cell wall biosynthesis